MMWNKQNIFEPSGCLSREAFSALLKDELPAGVKVTANEHIASCPFCSDAAEGFQIIAPEKDVAEVLAATDKVFAGEFFSNKKEKKIKIIWIALSTAATILLLIGLFTFIYHKQPQIPQLADNAVPAKRPDAPAGISKTDKPEPKNQIPQINVKDKTPVYKELNNAEVPQDQLSEQEIRSETVADELPKAASVQENENQKKEVSGSGASIAASDNAPANETKLAIKAGAYNGPEKDYTQQEEYAPAAASEAMRSNNIKSKKSGINKEILEQSDVARSQDTLKILIDELPTFQGGDLNKFREYVQNHLKYPESFKDTGISGKVFVQFAVDINGKVADIKILRGVHPDMDNEVIRVLENSPHWKQTEKPVKHQFTMQLHIK